MKVERTALRHLVIDEGAMSRANERAPKSFAAERLAKKSKESSGATRTQANKGALDALVAKWQRGLYSVLPCMAETVSF